MAELLCLFHQLQLMEIGERAYGLIKNIIFDVGRVLIRWEPELAMRNLGISEETITVLSEAFFAEGAWNEEDRGALAEEEILDFLISRAPSCGSEIRLFWEHVEDAICQFPYARPLIQDLKAQGYQVYILSNYGRTTFQKTKEKALSFLQDADGVFFSFEVKKIKPEPEIYRLFLERFGLLPEECVFLDDMPENIEGAEAAGIHGIVFQNIEQAKQDLKAYGVACSPCC